LSVHSDFHLVLKENQRSVAEIFVRLRVTPLTFLSVLDGEDTEKQRLNPKGIVSFSPDI